MNHQFIEARELIVKAREALCRGDKASARHLGEKAALLAPEMEDVWLVLAASDPNPQDALAYAQKALEINPQSTRAHRGVEWASSRLKQVDARPEPSRHSLAPSATIVPAAKWSGRAGVHQTQVQARAEKDRIPVSPKIVPNRVEVTASLPNKRAYQTVIAMPALQSQERNWLLPALLIGAGCMVVGFFILFALTSPALASIVSRVSAPAPTQENLWAPAEIAKPEVVPIHVSAFSPSNVDNVSSAADAPQSNSILDAVSTATDVSTVTSTAIPTEEPASTPAATETPGSMAIEIVDDTLANAAPAPSAPEYASGNGERWIDVDLTNQSVYAYEGDVVVNSFIVSTGTWLTPTVTGTYRIYIKIRSGSMHGPGYFLPDVPYIMYFYKSYGLHGTYWHKNFGTPMSHGCINLRTDDAAWLFDWASVGTVVYVHY
jgi:lipoprotein-anchoring transpeptidase ErfK/SrfK